jgi:hypothetical protein
MKTRILALTIALFGVFTLGSSFKPVYGQLPGSVTMTIGDCVATLSFVIGNIEVNDGRSNRRFIS